MVVLLLQFSTLYEGGKTFNVRTKIIFYEGDKTFNINTKGVFYEGDKTFNVNTKVVDLREL